MRVGIDAHMVGGQETGNETYIKGLIGGLHGGHDDLELVVFHAGEPWKKPSPGLRFRRLSTGNPFVRLGIELPLRSLSERLDILHMTYAAPAWSAARVVLTVHDICFASHPEWFSPRDVRVLSTVVPRSLRQAAHVIAVSKFVRADIIDRYGVLENRISAIPNAPGPGADPIGIDEARHLLANLGLNLQRPYLLAVGNLQPRKNLVRLMEAFMKLVTERGHDLELVIAGPRHFRAEDVVQASGTMAARIHFTGYVSDRQLAACYSQCAVFVFPSLYEGFGIPAIEAMAHGVPVASSNGGALPEICGNAALMFDPQSVPAITEAVDRILRQDGLRRQLIGAGRTRAAEFSWTRTAALTREVYEKASA